MERKQSGRAVRVLVVEDSDDDAVLMERELQRTGFSPESVRVEDADSLARALQAAPFDLVLSDYALPSLDGFAALELIRLRDPELPVIIVSRAIGEEQAVALMRAGAQDFVSKGNLARLGPAVERELADSSLRRERREAVRALAASERRHRALLEALPVGVFQASAEGTIQTANPRFLAMLGYRSEDEARGVSLQELFVEPTLRRRLTEVETDGDPFELQVRRRDGSLFWGLCRLSPGRTTDGTVDHVIGALEDVTLRHKLEVALSQGKEEWERTFDAVRELIVITDPLLAVVRANRAVAERLSVHPREVVGRVWTEVVGEKLPPVDLRRLLEAARTGSSIDYDLSSELLGGDFRFSATPRFDHDGAIVGAIHVGRDVTTQRQIEELLRRQVAVDQAEHIFRTFRHEAGNALNTLKTTLTVFRASYQRFSADQRETYFDRCFESLRIAEQLLAALRTYQTLDQVTLRPLDLTAFFKQRGDLLFAAAREKGVSCVVQLPSGPLEVSADPDALVRILLNLIDNAVAATAGTDAAAITVSCRAQGGSTVVQVRDNGAGIAPEHLPRLFQPLFTTKREGSGMGLAIVQKLMLRMNGLAVVHSEAGQGTAIELHFSMRGTADGKGGVL